MYEPGRCDRALLHRSSSRNASGSDEVRVASGLTTKIDANRVTAASRISHCIRERGGTDSALLAREGLPSRRLVILHEGMSFRKRRRLRDVFPGPVGAEHVSGDAENHGFFSPAEAIPIEGYDCSIALEPDVLGAPVAMADHGASHASDALAGRSRDTVEYSAPCRSVSKSNSLLCGLGHSAFAGSDASG